jgi:diacylglycerol kinase (ATP)
MTMRFDEILIIFNPNSTGNSKKNAYAFAYELEQRMPKQRVTVTATKHAGHAETLAKEYASRKNKVLIVSSSGDGGYNEVVNGVMSVKNGNAVTAVLPSGNANDHATALGSDDLAKAVVAGKVQKIELLKIATKVGGESWERYAHSYIGFGLTPKVGRELTLRRLNALTEKWHVFYHLLKFKHVDLTVKKEVRRFSSIVFATISRMSKVVKLDQNAQKNDGKMEVYETDYRSFWQLLSMLAHASLRGLSKNHRLASYELLTLSKTLVQLDGEVFTIDADTKVRVTCEKDALETIL